MEELGSIPFIRDVAKKTDSTKYAMPALRSITHEQKELLKKLGDSFEDKQFPNQKAFNAKR